MLLEGVTGIAKLVVGSTVVAGAIGGSYAALNSSQSERMSPNEFVVKVTGTPQDQQYKITCDKAESGPLYLRLESTYEEYKFFCRKTGNEGKLYGSFAEGNSKNELSCEYKHKNNYECTYTPAAGGVNKNLKKVTTDRATGSEKPLLELRPDDRGNQ
ncbi:hypothetical protein MHLP_02690 [Candidatus Mycoplasma haematolamae str. Purdue]|uniref:Uncharacterized protein n=1 Tax=Mycoplasma haematolamae (strain Purdue) TaxID=1212765 RepID=I7BJS5_MYCHA|nr:hypothetical protein [Candidatus Mycoplasma haematolamae]AFO52118.1 hypothetical protein MHLP_02690 [Candidatus Mycoplasma haematolamae str. Purdue]